KKCVLFNAPVGQGAQFSGVVSVLNPPEPLPKGVLGDPATARSQLVDAVVEADEALMEKYLMEGTVSPEELAAALPKALAAGTVVPIFCTSAKKDKDIGIQELLDAIVTFGLSPAEGQVRTAKRGSSDKAEEVNLA